MKKVVKLRPGQKGTLRLAAQYGSALLCVRYRYDEARGRRIKTAEIIVEECDWSPPAPRYPASAMVSVRIRVEEKALQSRSRLQEASGNRNGNTGWCFSVASLEPVLKSAS